MDKIGLSLPLQKSAPVKPPKTGPKTPSAGISKDIVSLDSQKAVKEKEWTVLYYFSARNNLAKEAMSAVEQIREAGSDRNVNAVYQLGTESKTLRGKAASGEKTEKLPTKDMGSARTLGEFLDWGMKKYPAKHYAVMLFGHSGGFWGALHDEESDTDISAKELGNVFRDASRKAGKKIDVAGFETCLMGQAEVAYELKDGVKYMVASEDTTAECAPDYEMLKDLQQGIREKKEITAKELSQLMVYEFKHTPGARQTFPTMSAVNLEKMKPLSENMDRLAGSFMEAIKKDPTIIRHIRSDIAETQHFEIDPLATQPYTGFADLRHFCEIILKDKDITDPAIRENAALVSEDVREMVVAEEHTSLNRSGNIMENSHGLSVFLPRDYGKARPGEKETFKYDKTSFAEKTRWDEFLEVISSHGALVGFLKKCRVPDEILDAGVSLKELTKKLYTKIPFFTGGLSYLNLSAAFTKNARVLPVLAPVSAFDGARNLLSGTKNLKTAAQSDWDPDAKKKIVTDASLKTVAGIATLASVGGMLAGIPLVAAPAAAIALVAGLAKPFYDSMNEFFSRAQDLPEKTIDAKLQEMDKKA